MPKVIEDLDKLIIEKAKEILFEQGISQLTIRNVARECNVAVGTIYNYYKSKEMILASIMIGDWMAMLVKTKGEIAKCDDPIEACRVVYLGIRGFSDIYRSSWKSDDVELGSTGLLYDRHQMLIGQVAEVLMPIFEMQKCENAKVFSRLLATKILEAAIDEVNEFSEIEIVAKKFFE